MILTNAFTSHRALIWAAGLALLTSCDSGERLDSKANAIEIGAAKTAVIAIMQPPTKTEFTNVLGVARESYMWESRGIRCEVHFVLDRVVAKSCTSSN